MLKNSGTQEKKRKSYITGNIIVVIWSFLRIIPFLAIKQTSPLGVRKYTVGYPKAKALAQFINSKAFSYPLKKEAV